MFENFQLSQRVLKKYAEMRPVVVAEHLWFPRFSVEYFVQFDRSYGSVGHQRVPQQRFV